jgi:hypothetical protein
MKKSFLAIFACMFACVALSAQSLKFTTQPTMVQSTANTIVLKWETSLPTHTEIQYSTSANMKWEEDATESTTHEFLLHDLEPNTTYYVRVISKSGSAGIVTPLKSFSTTSPIAEASAPASAGTR